MAKGDIRRGATNGGMATAGIILGIIGIIVAVLVVALVVAAAS